MKSAIHTSKISKNAAFFSLLKPLVPAREVQSPYSELVKYVNVLCEEYSDVFLPLEGIPPDRDIEFIIDLKDELTSPLFLHCYRLSLVELAEVHKQLADLLKHGWVHPSYSPYGVPILFV